MVPRSAHAALDRRRGGDPPSTLAARRLRPPATTSASATRSRSASPSPSPSSLYLGRYRIVHPALGLGESRMRMMAIGAIVLTLAGTSLFGGVGAVVEPAASAAGGCRSGHLTAAQDGVPAGSSRIARAAAGQSVTTPSSSCHLGGVDAPGLAPGVDPQTPRAGRVDEGRCHHRPVGGDAIRTGPRRIVEELAHVVRPLGVAQQRRLDLRRVRGGMDDGGGALRPELGRDSRGVGCGPPTARLRRLPGP